MPGQTLNSSPNILGLYAKAAWGSLPLPGRDRRASRGEDLSGLRIRLEPVKADKGDVSRYRKVCGFAPGAHLPPTYPHVLVFPLHLALMTDERFPFPPVGAVHIANTIRQHRPIGVDEELSFEVMATDMQPHTRGRQITFISECTIDGSPVWQGETVILHRESRSGTTVANQGPAVPDRPATGPLVWKLPSNLGRQYASVSGDRNPIHLYDVTAMPLGFRHHIAHGMWSKARCLAELSNRVPDAFSISVAFKKPITLPSSVRFGARQDGGVIDFGLASARSGSAHLLGRIEPL